MKHSIFKYILVILILLPSLSFADAISKREAQTVAYNFYIEKSQIESGLTFGEDFTMSKGNTVLYYVFNVNEGYIVISGDDQIHPIIAYSLTSEYRNQNQPPAFKWWMDNVAFQISTALDNKVITSPEIKSAWNKYLDKKFSSQFEKSGVEPLTYIHWGQGCYYNEDFPVDSTGPCNHAFTGCVATAMAQIIKHYNYPEHGTGTHGYNSTYGWLEVDFENTYYNWTDMNYQLNYENEAVAELIYHCGVSINTIFVQGGSGAYDFDVREALVDYYNYSNEAQFYWRDDYTGDWLAMLRDELDLGRPILYGGADSTYYTGHTLVCDGYQDSIFFHFNWGVDGQFDGYFNVDELSAGGYLFNFQQDAIIGIKPDISGIVELYPPEDLNAETVPDIVSLSWTPPTWPGNLEFLGYNIYRNGLVVNPKIIIETGYTDSIVPAGSHIYQIKSVFIGAESGFSEMIEVEVEGSWIYELESFSFQVYPNPARDFIEINGVENSLQEFDISLIDLSGKVVFYKKINHPNGDKLKIALPQLTGVFLLRIESGKDSFSQKLILM